MNRKPYSASMTKHLFWFSEFKTAVRLLNEGKNMDEIKTLNKTENLFNARTTYRGKTVYNAIAARIKAVPDEFIIICDNIDIESQKLIAVITVMAAESLFFDFMYEVYREKLIVGDRFLTMGDFAQFFRNKQVQSDKVATWTDMTLNRLSRTYRSILLNSGLLKNLKRNEWTLEKPILNRQLIDVIKKAKMDVFYSALTGETL
jgi:hypothetical protein